MLPQWHALVGFIFAGALYLITPLNLFQVGLFFFASVLIDFDHYVLYVLKKKDFSLRRAYVFLNGLPKGRHKPAMMLFHTIEFHIFTALLIFLWPGFLFVLIGMLFHSLSDFISDFPDWGKEFFLIKYLVSDKSNYL